MFDQPRMPEPAPPSGDDAATWVMRQPGVKAATLELVAEAAERLGLRSPVGPEDFQRIITDRLFRQRFAAVVEATMFS